MNSNENAGLSKYTISFGRALAAASVVNGLLVIAKEKSPAVMSALQKLTGHHWISHSFIVLGVFFALGFLLAPFGNGAESRLNPGRLIAIAVSGVALGGALILGFYLVGD